MQFCLKKRILQSDAIIDSNNLNVILGVIAANHALINNNLNVIYIF